MERTNSRHTADIINQAGSITGSITNVLLLYDQYYASQQYMQASNIN